jgi:hypothetical protein
MSSEEFEYFFDPEELEPFLTSREFDAGTTCPTESAQRREIVTTAASVMDEPTTDQVKREVDTPIDSICQTRPTPSSEAEAGRAPEPVNNSERTRVRQLLSVHALGQFEYCPRSAILAAELGDETDIAEPPPRLDYLPNFDVERIEEWLSKCIRRLQLGLLLTGGLLLPMIAGLVQANRLLFYPFFVLFLVCLMWLMQLACTTLQLAARRRAALRAEVQEPEPWIEGITEVNWWSMLKAGFEAVYYQQPFRHPELPLEGRPWRVLERGSLRIPVVRSGSTRLGDRKHHVFPKHQVRLAAYALLVETGHVEVPYGLIFPADSVDGLAVPITRSLKENVSRRLDEFLQVLRQSQNGKCEPSPPRDRRRCEKCRHGEPQPVREGEVDRARKAGTTLLVLRQANGRRHHCLCGDRFGSAPPHGKSIQLGLTSALG